MDEDSRRTGVDDMGRDWAEGVHFVNQSENRRGLRGYNGSLVSSLRASTDASTLCHPAREGFSSTRSNDRILYYEGYELVRTERMSNDDVLFPALPRSIPE